MAINFKQRVNAFAEKANRQLNDEAWKQYLNRSDNPLTPTENKPVSGDDPQNFNEVYHDFVCDLKRQAESTYKQLQ